MKPSWIVYGQQDTGKTLHARAIARALGVRYIVDEWDGQPATYQPRNTLHLINVLPASALGCQVMTIGEALDKVREARQRP